MKIYKICASYGNEIFETKYFSTKEKAIAHSTELINFCLCYIDVRVREKLIEEISVKHHIAYYDFFQFYLTKEVIEVE